MRRQKSSLREARGIGEGELVRPTMPSSASATRRAVRGLEPYAGPWNEATAAHLLKRTMFGPTRSEIVAAAASSLDIVVEQLLTPQPPPAPPPDPNIPGRDWTIVPFSDIANINYQYDRALRRWWLGLMLKQGNSVTEKMTLFWHNSLASQAEVVRDAQYMYRQNVLFRTHALGNIRQLIKDITIDPAMLRFLNGYLNRIPLPDENYARELLELFTIGKGPQIGPGDYTTYTENDVKAAARVLTGWTDRRQETPSRVVFIEKNHDKGTKQFSAAFGNAVIGPTFNEDGSINGYQEMSSLVDLIFSRRETANAFCRRLYRWFVYYDIDAETEAAVIAPLGEILWNNNFDVRPVLDTLLRSEHFFDVRIMGCIIKNPIDLVVGTARRLLVPFAGGLPDNDTFLRACDDFANELQMHLLEPPSVAGWPAYHQVPGFHEHWINTTTLPARGTFTDSVVYGIRPYFSAERYEMDVLEYAKTLSEPANPFRLVEEIASDLLPPIRGGMPITPEQKEYLLYHVMYLVRQDEYEWTAKWNSVMADPANADARVAVSGRLKLLMRYVMQLPEYQLM